MTEWRPIETAPSDGTEILIWHELTGWYVVAFFDGDDRRWVDALYARGIPNPTHWMPLPAPPEAA